MEVNNILQIMDAFENSSVGELDFQEGNQRIKLRKSAVSSENIVYTKPHNEVKATSDVNIIDESSQVVKSPLVGTFYAAKGEGEKPFVEVGDTVKAGQVLAIIEAMKLMNEVTSEYEGVVDKILVKNEQLVEYGQDMFVIRQA